MRIASIAFVSCALAACGLAEPEPERVLSQVSAQVLGVDCDAGIYAYTPPPTPTIRVSTSPIVADRPTRAKRSFVIVDHTALADLSAAGSGYELAPRLRELGAFTRHQACVDTKAHTDDLVVFSKGPFRAARLDTTQHNTYPGPHIGTVATIANSYDTLLANWPDDPNSDGPFRLLAVVNRLDLAGDNDSRGGGHFAADHRRWFGEGRLVFGTTNIGANGTVMQMTFIAEFRLPALKKTADTGATLDFEVDASFNWELGDAATGKLTADQQWRQQRQYWATVWNELSRYEPASNNYKNLLAKIVKLFARGENFIALRTGENVRKSTNNALTPEFEYREFYLGDTYDLASRKNRREAMRCEADTTTLATHIDADWNVHDFHFDYAPGDRTLTSDEQVEIVGANLDGGACGGVPFGNGTDGDIGFRANFVRFKVAAPNQTTPWSNLKDTSPKDLAEEKRHAFGVGTCSGCHFSETASTLGFHIAPRASDAEDAAVSHFLNLNLEPHSADLVVNGVPRHYSYNELANREDLLDAFLQQHDFSADYAAGARTRTNEMLLCNGPTCSQTIY